MILSKQQVNLKFRNGEVIEWQDTEMKSAAAFYKE